MNLTRRPRRLRRTAQIRNLVHEVDVRCDDLIYPVFVTEGENVQSPIESMPGIYHYSLVLRISAFANTLTMVTAASLKTGKY